jgi:hypothetical protein
MSESRLEREEDYARRRLQESAPFIPCGYCQKNINLDHVNIGIAKIQMLGLKFSMFPFLGISLQSDVVSLAEKFVIKKTDFSLNDLYIWICPPDSPPSPGIDCLVLTCCYECLDKLCLQIINTIYKKNL